MAKRLVNFVLPALYLCVITSCVTHVKNEGEVSPSDHFTGSLKFALKAPKPAILNDQNVFSTESDEIDAVKLIITDLQSMGARRIQRFDLGVYAKLGGRVVFVAERKKVPSFDRLYWVMVKILSEKYGCFIKRKIDSGDQVYFQCKDQRTIVMQRRIARLFAVLQSRQYDQNGVEIRIAEVNR